MSVAQVASMRVKMAAFLAAYKEEMVIEKALDKTGLHRYDILNWRKDEDFRIAFEAVEAGITDKAHEMALKHAGILPWTEDEKDERKYATSNFRAVEVLLRRDPRYRDSGISVTNNVMALTINGVTGEQIKKLVTPDSPQAQLQDSSIEVMPEGRDKLPDADVGLTSIQPATSIPPVMAPLLAKRIADYEASQAEGRS